MVDLSSHMCLFHWCWDILYLRVISDTLISKDVCYFKYFYMDMYVISDTCVILDTFIWIHVISDTLDTWYFRDIWCGILETFYMVFWIYFTWVCIHYFIDVLFYIDVHIMFMLNVCMFSIFIFLFHRSCVNLYMCYNI